MTPNTEPQEKHIPDFSTVGMRPKIRQGGGQNWISENKTLDTRRAKEGGEDVE